MTFIEYIKFRIGRHNGHPDKTEEHELLREIAENIDMIEKDATGESVLLSLDRRICPGYRESISHLWYNYQRYCRNHNLNAETRGRIDQYYRYADL